MTFFSLQEQYDKGNHCILVSDVERRACWRHSVGCLFIRILQATYMEQITPEHEKDLNFTT